MELAPESNERTFEESPCGGSRCAAPLAASDAVSGEFGASDEPAVPGGHSKPGASAGVVPGAVPDDARLPERYAALYRECRLCPRNCGVDRAAGKRGVCGAPARLKLGRAALHWWEEPCLVGEQGSGAIFFSYCPMHCVYCQNRALAEGDGIEVPNDQLGKAILRLQNEEHAANINLVTPTHYLPHIAWTLERLKAAGALKMPVVYNCSGYESPEALRLLDGLVDVYLVDFKYANALSAQKFSHCADYPQVALAAIKQMIAQVGEWVQDERSGLLERGVIIRHLVLPGHVEDSVKAVRLLCSQLDLSAVRLSIMNQFVPVGLSDAEMLRLGLVSKASGRLGVVEPEEYEAVLDVADALGVDEYFWQEGGANRESFIPAFDGTGVR